jgi:hypothetical protein
MITSAEIQIRAMRRSELDLALSWAAAEGWNPGLFDAESFYNADQNGFFIAECDGQPIGSFSAVAYDQTYGFAGLFIVLPEYRGGRCGVELGRRGLEHLGSRTIGLDGVRAKLENYLHWGFTHAYWTIHFSGNAPGNPSSIGNPRSMAGTTLQIENLRDLSFDLVNEFDASYFPAVREKFLHTWINQAGHTALGAIQKDRLVGYGVIRPCRMGYKIGPLLAEAPSVAELLLDALLATIPASEYFIDVPEPNTAAMELVKRRSMHQVFETARMYRGPAPQIDLQNIFGVTTLELG